MNKGWLALGGLFVALAIVIVIVAVWQAIYFAQQQSALESNEIVFAGMTLVQFILAVICGVLAFMSFREY